MKVAIIGAGAAGLVAARHFSKSDCEIKIFEKTSFIGGTWNYSENIETPISAMYLNLRTNLPKELMEFEGLNYNENISYLPWKTVLEYLKQYAKKFDLEKYINFNTEVINVSKFENKWKLITKNVTEYFDSILICNGHYSVPFIPYFKGIENFKGTVIHSHVYRVPEFFLEKNVLMIGIGPSGQDIAFDIAKAAKKVYMSHHNPNIVTNQFPLNTEHKTDVDYFLENSVCFKDGSFAKIDSVLYCTGYKYSFPFLDQSCNINIDDNYVNPLYKHFISIKNPSMAFIGLPFRTLIFPMFEIQVKCFLKLLLKQVHLPSEFEMMEDTLKFEKFNESNGIKKKSYHNIKDGVRKYFSDLETLGNIEPVKEYIMALFERCSEIRKNNLANYRDEVYKVISDDKFIIYSKSK